MALTSFDHVNIRTGQLDALVDWYGKVLDLHPGARPPFPFPGAWLYLGDRAVIHIIGLEETLQAGDNLTLEHFAFRATGFADFRAGLEAQGIAHSVDPVPGAPIVQINLFDPDGNHIHVDFTAEDAAL